MVQFENECEYVDATMEEYLNWISCSKEDGTKRKRRKEDLMDTSRSSFESFDPNDYWAYADYKYMNNLVGSNRNQLEQNVNN